MKKLLLMVGIAVTTGYTLKAQTVSRQVVASAGSYVSTPAGSVSATTGELVIATGSSGSFMLTQGFQQPDANPTGIQQKKEVMVTYNLYPNPAMDNISISLQSPEEVSVNFYIYDVSGKLLEKTENNRVQTSGYNRSFNIANYTAGNYFFKIISSDGSVVKTIPFTKK